MARGLTGLPDAKGHMLEIINLHANVEGNEILHGIDLKIGTEVES